MDLFIWSGSVERLILLREACVNRIPKKLEGWLLGLRNNIVSFVLIISFVRVRLHPTRKLVTPRTWGLRIILWAHTAFKLLLSFVVKLRNKHQIGVCSFLLADRIFSSALGCSWIWLPLNLGNSVRCCSSRAWFSLDGNKLLFEFDRVVNGIITLSFSCACLSPKPCAYSKARLLLRLPYWLLVNCLRSFWITLFVGISCWRSLILVYQAAFEPRCQPSFLVSCLNSCLWSPVDMR